MQHTWTNGLISLSGGSFDNLIDKIFIGMLSAVWNVINKFQIVKNPTTTGLCSQTASSSDDEPSVLVKHL